MSGWSSVNLYLPLIGGIAVIVTLLTAPDGQVGLFSKVLSPLATGMQAHSPAAGRGCLEALRLAHERGRQPPRARPHAESVAEVEDLTVRFGGVVAVNGVSLDVRPGEIHGLIGPNGSGKTTLIDAVTGFVRSEGKVTLGEKSLVGRSARLRARAGLVTIVPVPGAVQRPRASGRTSPWPLSRRGPGATSRPVRPWRIRLSPNALEAMREFELDDSRHASRGGLLRSAQGDRDRSRRRRKA